MTRRGKQAGKEALEKKRILVDCIPWDGGRSGMSAYTRGLVEELRRQGHELTLLCEPWADIAEGAGLPVVRAPKWTAKPMASMLWHLYGRPWWVPECIRVEKCRISA